jgi:hypothetical protein
MGAIGVGVEVGIGETDGVGFISGVCVGVGEGIAFPAGAIFTLFFHTNFFPDLTQVYFTFLLTEMLPTLLQLCPAFTAAVAVELIPTTMSRENRVIAKYFLLSMNQGFRIQELNGSSSKSFD